MQLIADKVSKIFIEVALLYNKTLNAEDHGLNYLLKRCLPKELANKHLFGYVNSQTLLWDNLVKTGKFDIKELIELDLIKIDLINRTIYEYFQPGRLVMPIFKDGKITCFSARACDEITEPKYKTLKYDKIGIFNLDILTYGHKYIYIAEGVIDALTLNYLGFPSLGILGLSNLGKEHLDPFLGYKGNIVLLFDNDSNGSGDKGIERIGNLLSNNGLSNIFYKKLPRNNGDKKIDVNQFYCENGFHTSKMKISELPLFKFNPTWQKIDEYIPERKGDSPPILEIVSKYMELKRETAVRHRGICPFPDHMDSTPSFVIYEDSNTFRCFGCNRGGSVYKFIMDLKNLTYQEAKAEIKG